MKKFIFPIFAICVYGPSFANVCNGNPVIENNQLLAYDTTLHKLGNRVTCDATTNKKRMVGCDGKIYVCTTSKWQLVSKIPNCPEGWKNSSARNGGANTISNPTDEGNIYFFNVNLLENSFCKYTVDQCNKDIAECKNRGDYPASCTICGPAGSITGATTNTPFTITCDDTAGNGCRISGNIDKFEIRQCSDIKAISHGKPVVITKNKNTRCITQIGNLKRTCDIVLRETDEYYVYVCGDDPIFITKGTKYDYNNEKDLSYEEKKCRGSGGDFKDDKCTCPNSQTKPENGECLCPTGNTKYLVGNNCNEGTACISTGGDPKDDSKCDCPEHMRAVKLRTDSDIEVCECNKGYQYRDPMRRWEGCVKINDTVAISGTVVDDNGETIPYATVKVSNSSNGTNTDDTGRFSLQNVPNTEYVTFSSIGYKTTTWAATDLQDAIVRMYTNTETLSEVTVTASPLTQTQSEQVAPTGTKEYECTKSGGDKYENGKCICNADKYLEEYEPKNAPGYSICRCMYGYKRKGGTLGEDGRTITEYPDGAECEYAGTETVEKVFDSAQWRKDTEDAYRNEYDNAQSWANKGITAGSTLLTGEGAMMAAQAIAEQKADKKAEEQMAEWISKMGCEYGNGQQVNLGKEETLPAGDLAKYYAEYKQLADKLKETKTALNLRPGIESEVLYDRAETGLYQYANAERQSGGFTSLSRALMNPEGADAEQWNAQKAEVAKDLTTGTLLTAGGLVVGAAGNYLVNRNHKKEYQDLIQKTTNVIKKIERDYPELFKPKEQEPMVEIVEETPEEETYTTTFDIETTERIFESDTFKSGYLTLSETGKNALTKFARDITTEFENNENTKITKVTIAASGFADPDPINKGWGKQLTQQYMSELGTDSLPDYYNEQIDKNEELARARAENVMNYLAKQFRSDITATKDTATGAVDNNCKTTDTKAKKAECRHVNLTLQIETKTTAITKN